MSYKKVSVVSIVLNNFKHDSRVLKTAQTLQNNNYDVTVVALHEEPLLEFEKIENFNTHRVKLLSRKWPKKKIFQLFKYLEFIIRVVKQYRKTDVLHCNDLDTLPIGFIIKLFLNRNIKVIYDAHEYEINDVPNESKNRIKFKYYIERSLIGCADKIITVSASIAQEYSKLYGIEKPELVLNCPHYETVPHSNKFREQFNIQPEQSIFLYQGALSRGRGIELLLEAFEKMTSNKNVIVFMGYGQLEPLISEYANRSKNIFKRDAVAPDVLLSFTASADYGISFIEDSCLSYRYCLPNKMFEYLMSGIPIITSNLVEMSHLIESENVGVVAETNTIEGFLMAITKISALDSNKLYEKIRAVKHKYSWESQEKVLLNIYKEI